MNSSYRSISINLAIACCLVVSIGFGLWRVESVYAKRNATTSTERSQMNSRLEDLMAKTRAIDVARQRDVDLQAKIRLQVNGNPIAKPTLNDRQSGHP